MNVSLFKKKKKRGVEITKMHRNVSQIHVAFYPKKNYLALQTTWMKLHVYTIPPPHPHKSTL